MENPFTYQALDHGLSQIRVFSVFPASDHTAPLRGKLRTEQFSPTVPTYEAISYVWGEREGKELLEVNNKELMITCNLASALRRVRYKDRRRDLWIDAVCIDQNSPEEKSQQVRKMHRIYSSASRVLIWLGEKVLSTVRGGDFQRLWLNDEDSSKAITRVMNHIDRWQQEGFHADEDGICIQYRTELLFMCKWWERVWTIQEGAVANEHSLVLWGAREVSWTYLMDLVERANSLQQAAEPDLPWQHPDSDFVRVYRHYHLSGTIPLEDLIYVSSQRYASDPRDVIYALLGLVRRQFFTSLEADYTQSTTWAFQRAVVSVITARNDLEFLLNIVFTRSWENWTETPSWSYDFTKRGVFLSSRLKVDLSLYYHLAQEGASTGRSFVGIRHDAQASTVKITGAVIGSVAESQMIYTDCYSDLVEPECNFFPLQHPYIDPFVPWLFQTLQDFTAIARRAWSKRFSSDKVNAKIDKGDVWRISMNGRTVEDLRVHMHPKTAIIGDEWEIAQRHSTLDAWRNMLVREKNGLAEDREREIAKRLYRIVVAKFNAYKHWMGCLFTTTSGYVGFAHKKVQAGDILCILFGCAMPLVLRPQKDGTYRIVDIAYVEDVMEGQFLRDKANYTDMDFVIS